MRRRHSRATERVIRRRLAQSRRAALWLTDYIDRFVPGGKRAALLRRHQQRGRWFKRHPYDCGQPRCEVCHGDKLHRRRLCDRRADGLAEGD